MSSIDVSEAAIEKAVLTTEARKKLPRSAFVFPDEEAYPIHDEKHARAALQRVSQHGTPEQKAKVRAAVKRRYPNIEQSKAESIALTVPIWKRDDEQQIVYGVALEPNLVDSQDDVVEPDEIEKAAHDFMEFAQRADVQHSEREAAACLVENYIAPHDMTVGGKLVTKSSWVQAWKITDPELWDDIREERLTGLSIGGSGERV